MKTPEQDSHGTMTQHINKKNTPTGDENVTSCLILSTRFTINKKNTPTGDENSIRKT